MAIRPELLDELLKECENPEELLGQNGLIKELTKGLVERMLHAEMTDHLGYEKHMYRKYKGPFRGAGQAVWVWVKRLAV